MCERERKRKRKKKEIKREREREGGGGERENRGRNREKERVRESVNNLIIKFSLNYHTPRPLDALHPTNHSLYLKVLATQPPTTSGGTNYQQ